ncbi:MAG: hypothetical protein EOM50_17090 [Erysipelotrichia bacterium]|nr:hypothetical protein [Erysipelotrichia bacterium]
MKDCSFYYPVTNVRVPLWSDPKQKDISWFQMTKKSNNVYEYV